MICLSLLAMIATAPAANATLSVDLTRPTVNVSPDLFGIFFEEINCAGDGGLYPELVRNRSFEDSDKPNHWSLAPGSSGSIELRKLEGSQFNQSYLRINSTQNAGAVNEGYWGMAIEKGKRYNLELDVKCTAPIVAYVLSHEGRVLAQEELTAGASDWRILKATLTANGSDNKAQLVVRVKGAGTADLNSVSLMPEDTFKNRPNGLRKDLAQHLSELRPGFMRFPGGCWVEGDTMALSQRWKQTVGDIFQRRTQPNIWNYMSTNGLGYHEYLQLCEDLKAAPLFVINCGMSHKEVVPMDKMGEYVQDALDAIEYANGDVTTKWGRLRAENGHPKPFNLKYMEIGNENGGPPYEERYALIYHAIKAKYPQIHLIADVWGGTPKKTPVDIIDEHYYSNPAFFLENADRYDRYDRKGPKVYIGEYAVTQGVGSGNLTGALAEAAFMTGIERNSDHVIMASYAPLFANTNIKVWNPDLIYFDSSKSCGTPSYYVQQMFGQNRPTQMVQTTLTQPPAKMGSFPAGGIGVGTWLTQAEYKDIEVSQGGKVIFTSADGKGLKSESGTWSQVDGAYRQGDGGAEGARASAGSPTWQDYTVTLKARKLSGAEGFMVTVGERNKDNYIWWNIGGWGNSQDALEMAVDGGKTSIGRQRPNRIETGRWYNLKLEYTPTRIRGFIDGVQTLDATYPTLKTLFASAGTAGGETIIKLINTGDQPLTTDVKLSGAKGSKLTGTQTTLTGGPRDENTLDQPRRVYPKAKPVTVNANGFKQELPAHSLVILRFKKSS